MMIVTIKEEDTVLFVKIALSNTILKTKNMDHTDRNNKMIQMYLVGHPTTEIGKQFNMTRARVCQILQKDGIALRKMKAASVVCALCNKTFLRINGLKKRCRPCVEKRKKMWASIRGFDCCVLCGKNDNPHVGEGLCNRCNSKRLYRESEVYRKNIIRLNKINYQKNKDKPDFKTKVSNYQRKWYQKNKHIIYMNNLLRFLMKRDGRY